VAVLGTGGVGAFTGGLLAAAGLDVTLIGRARRLEPVRTGGMTIRRPQRAPIHVRPRVVLDGERVTEKFEVVLLSVKAFDVEASIPMVEQLLEPTGTVVALQNGVGSDAALLDRLGRDAVVAGTLTASVALDHEGNAIQYNRRGGFAWASYGVMSYGPDLGGWFQRAGLQVAHVDGALSLRWSKLLLNVLGAAQSAILGLPVAVVMQGTAGFRIEQLAFRETLAVMRALQVSVCDLPGYPARLAAAAMRLPAPVAQKLLAGRVGSGRGGKAPGLAADVASGRGRTEIDYLSGAVVDAGNRLGVRTPINAALTTLVRALEKGESPPAGLRTSADLLAHVTESGTAPTDIE